MLALRERAAYRTVVVTVPDAAALAARIQDLAAAAASAWVAAEAAKLVAAEAALEAEGGGSGDL